jgi:chaperonin GroES
MPTATKSKVPDYVIIPLQGRILFRKDEAEDMTSGGIALPDSSKKENLTGRVIEISPDVENNEELPVNKYDKVLVDPVRCIPVDFDQDNRLFIIPIDDVIAVFKKTDEGKSL